MDGWTAMAIPPRLTPSPQPYNEHAEGAVLHAPLRMSIYSHPHASTWHIHVVPYDTKWSTQFDEIQRHLHGLFAQSHPPVAYSAIEHIGSTSVPGLAAKPNIDVLATFPSQEALETAVEALNWEIPVSPPFATYSQIPRGGGIPGRESYKIYLPTWSPYYATTPERSLYLIADIPENAAGQVQIRCYRTVRDVLLQDANRDLLDEYAWVKLALSKEVFEDPLTYSARKDGIVRKILLRGGWTMEEVEAKETLCRRELRWETEEAY